MEEKRVAVTLPRLYLGGVARVTIELLKRLEKIEGLDFTIFTTRINSKWHEKLETDVKKISPFPYPEIAYHRPDVKLELRKNDLIFNHSLYLNKLARVLETPFISVNHTLHSYNTSWLSRGLSIKHKIQQNLNQEGVRNLQYADRVVAVSDNIQSRCLDIYKAGASRIYNGGNSQWTEFSEENKNYIFAPDYKGRTMNRIAKDKPVKAIGKGQNTKINWLGSVTDQELADYYKKCSFIISDTWSEGHPLFPLEAAFCGKPAVLRNAGGNTEEIIQGKTGFIAENSYEFHKYVDKLWKNPGLRKKMGKNAYEYVKDNFTWEKAAKQYLTEMNDLMGTDFELSG